MNLLKQSPVYFHLISQLGFVALRFLFDVVLYSGGREALSFVVLYYILQSLVEITVKLITLTGHLKEYNMGTNSTSKTMGSPVNYSLNILILVF